MSKQSATRRLQRCLRVSRPHFKKPQKQKERQQPPTAASVRSNEAADLFRSQTAGLQNSEAHKKRLRIVHQVEL